MKPHIVRLIVFSALLAALPGAVQITNAQATLPRILTWVEAISGPEEELIRWPVAVAAGADGDFAVADAFGSRILVYRRDGISWKFERAVELSNSPAGLTYDGRRFLVSLRQDGGIVALEGPELSQRNLALPSGLVPGAIAAHESGDLLVFDVASQRVVLLSTEGKVQRETAINKYVSALAAGSQGGFFATVPKEATVLAFAADGTMQDEWTIPGIPPKPAWPMGLATEPGGDLYVADRHAGRILVLDGGGRWIGLGAREGWETGLLRLPGALAKLATGELLVVDSGNSRVQIFRRTDRSDGR